MSQTVNSYSIWWERVLVLISIMYSSIRELMLYFIPKPNSGIVFPFELKNYQVILQILHFKQYDKWVYIFTLCKADIMRFFSEGTLCKLLIPVLQTLIMIHVFLFCRCHLRYRSMTLWLFDLHHPIFSL